MTTLSRFRAGRVPHTIGRFLHPLLSTRLTFYRLWDPLRPFIVPQHSNRVGECGRRYCTHQAVASRVSRTTPIDIGPSILYDIRSKEISHSRGSGGNFFRTLGTASRRSCAYPCHRCLRHGTTVPIGRAHTHTPSPCARQGPRSNALRDMLRTWMGTRRRYATVSPSTRHGRAVPEAAVEGTRA